MQKSIVAMLMAGVALPAYAADLSGAGSLSGGYVAPSDQVLSSAPKIIGHLDMGVGYNNRDVSFGLPCEVDCTASEDFWTFQGAGRANIDLGMSNLELEVGGATWTEDSVSFSAIGTAAHLWGKFNNAALGVYGAVNFPTGSTVYTGGVEGQVYFGALTLGAEANYNWWDQNGGDADYWTARGYANFYLTPNTRIGGEVNYLAWTNDLDGSDAWGAKIDAEHRFAGTPLSVWAEGSYANADIRGGPIDVSTESWGGMIGIRVFMDGNMTQQEHDMNVPWDGGVFDADRYNRFLWSGGILCTGGCT